MGGGVRDGCAGSVKDVVHAPFCFFKNNFREVGGGRVREAGASKTTDLLYLVAFRRLVFLCSHFYLEVAGFFSPSGSFFSLSSVTNWLDFTEMRSFR